MLFSNLMSGFIFGTSCLACNRVSKALDPWLCEDCRYELIRLGKEPIVFNSDVICLYPMTPIIRRLIHALKYRSIPGLAHYLVRHSSIGNKSEAFHLIQDWGKEPFFLPVPIHLARFRERGYNQTEKIAQAISLICRGKMKRELFRNSFHVSQTALSVRDREMNVAGAFRCMIKKNENSFFRLRIIVDDVYTTGATTKSCMYSLLKAGVERVKTCTLVYEKPACALNDYVSDRKTEWLD